MSSFSCIHFCPSQIAAVYTYIHFFLTHVDFCLIYTDTLLFSKPYTIHNSALGNTLVPYETFLHYCKAKPLRLEDAHVEGCRTRLMHLYTNLSPWDMCDFLRGTEHQYCPNYAHQYRHRYKRKSTNTDNQQQMSEFSYLPPMSYILIWYSHRPSRSHSL